MNTIAFAHHKGGTGKTTACINVAGWLAKLGKRVLVIDLDPQGNATTGLGINRGTVEVSLLDVLKERVGIKESIVETRSGVHLIPATDSLLHGEQYLAEQKFSTTVLKKKLRSIQPYYDYLCIDTPPASSLLMLNGVVAAKNVIVPLDTGVFAVEAMETLRILLKTIGKLRGGPVVLQQFFLLEYPSFSFFGKNPTEEIEEALRDFLQTYCDEIPPIVKIPYSKRVYEAQKHGMPLSHHAPLSKVGRVYKKITKRLIKEHENTKIIKRKNNKSLKN